MKLLEIARICSYQVTQNERRPLRSTISYFVGPLGIYRQAVGFVPMNALDL